MNKVILKDLFLAIVRNAFYCKRIYKFIYSLQRFINTLLQLLLSELTIRLPLLLTI